MKADHISSQGYLYGKNCKECKDFQTAKRFINQYISDDQISLQDSCFYLNNYDHIEKRGGHRYARPSFASKFVLKQNKKYFHNGVREYCYHGTHPKNLINILQQGLKIPNGNTIKVANGNLYGDGVYSTKIPQYAQFYANCVQFQSKYCQIILLLRQDLNDIETCGAIDVYGQFSSAISNGSLYNLKKIHLLHQKLIGETDIQFMTKKEDSIVIEAVLVKIHDVQPIKGEFVWLNQKIGKIK